MERTEKDKDVLVTTKEMEQLLYYLRDYFDEDNERITAILSMCLAIHLKTCLEKEANLSMVETAVHFLDQSLHEMLAMFTHSQDVAENKSIH